LYGTAIEKNILGADSLIEDSPADITVAPGRVYHPRNYDNRFHGLVSTAEALASSLNVPAVKVLSLTGESAVLDNLQALGLTRLQSEDYYGPSLALGAIDDSLWEMTNAFRQLATENKVFSQRTRSTLFQILSIPENRRLTFGLDSLLSLPFPAAVKTGTSKDMRDNWCIGFTNHYTVGVWIGNFNGAPMWNVSGISGAAPIWRSLMLALHPNVVGERAAFVVPAVPLPSRTLTRIRYPATDMLVGWDPDIPARLQQLPIEIESPQPGHQIMIDGHHYASAQETLFWPLLKGRHQIELRDAKGDLQDQVHFQVR
jgi:penicillin-binding protein 1C